ncbi:hypothetical protein [Thermoflexus hugenholtzii]|uniref:Uncharacterized protein n=1 Tax=Thermoflexus hugenholtzii JAD2 TaxID=877466 RepID=A0A212QLQ9_9CHLR|nr:hypothetical protein [Thermoflexus hugenholtzii]SNB60168.1 hypothetical protein SAMN02746019_00003210 [Thermoflexus hugenholtzii JAD2]
MSWIRWFFKELWWYLTYEHYGKRRLRPATWGLLLTLPLLAAFYLLALGLGQRSALPGERPAPTLPPLTKTAVFAAVTATAQAPTRTPAPLCPEDPRLWKLVPIEAGLRDPQTGQPIRLPKPPQRIEPPCVYEGLARDLAHTLVPNPDVPAPSVEGKVLSVPWFWAPGMEVPQVQVESMKPEDFTAYYDAQGKRIDDLYLAYTAVATGDPDFPVLVYIYSDQLQLAWGVSRQEGREDLWGRYRIEGGEVSRAILAVAYDPKTRHWVSIAYKRPFPPRATHAVPAGSAEDLARLFGLPLWRRSELLSRFGLQDIFPETINPSTVKPIGTLIISPEGAEVKR